MSWPHTWELRATIPTVRDYSVFRLTWDGIALTTWHQVDRSPLRHPGADWERSEQSGQGRDPCASMQAFTSLLRAAPSSRSRRAYCPFGEQAARCMGPGLDLQGR